MTTRSIQTSPQLYARCGGLLYVAIILCGAFSEGFVTSNLVVTGDAAATAQHILAAPALWQAGVVANVLVVLWAVPLLWIEYLLLRPVSQSLALLSLLLNLISLAVEALSKVFLLLVLPALATAHPATFGPAQGPLLAQLALQAHDMSFNLALLFFGGTCMVNGYLLVKSGYFPKALGVLLQVAGASYLVACWAALFAPTLADALLPGVLLPPLIGEASVALWLLIKGVHLAHWQAQVTPPPVLPVEVNTYG
jgi:hypothetical protein